MLSLLGIFLMIIGFALLKARWTMMNIPRSKIRSIAMGMVEIRGTVLESEKMYSDPLLDTTCLHYSIEVLRPQGSGHEGSYKTVWSDSQGRYLYIDDGTGTVLVDTGNTPDWSATTVRVRPVIDERKPTEEEREKLKQMGAPAHGNIKITERIVEPGSELYILGTAMDNPFVEEATAAQSTEDIMIVRGKKNTLMIVSDEDEKDMIEHNLHGAIGFTLAGALLLAYGIYNLIAPFLPLLKLL